MEINKINEIITDNTVLEEQEDDQLAVIEEGEGDDKETYDFKNMSPDQKVTLWKTLYNKIYLSVYDEEEFVWRKLKRREYTEIMENTPDENIDDVVEYRQYLTIRTCVLSPDATNQELIDDLLEEYPGLLTSLSAEILKKSGFSKPLTIEI